METLYKALTEYGDSDAYAFHMPGHKRYSGEEISPFFREYYKRDITEIDGWDNLHHAEGRLRDAMERAAKLYHSNRTYFLVNGSTAGVLASVLAAVPHGGSLIMMRGSHRSAYHALLLGEIKGIYLKSDIDPETGLDLGVSPDDILSAAAAHPEAAAVFLTSPTYEGISMPLKQVAEALHQKNKILIVDAAHGAHLGMTDFLPENAVKAGADLVIHSLHKTLPAPTQTALLHVNGARVDIDRVERFFSVFQTSSPSYVLMAGIDECLRLMREHGKKLWEEFYARRRKLSEHLSELRYISVVDTFLPLRIGADCERAYYLDLCKMLLIPKDSRITAGELYDKLRLDYHLQPEMAAPGYVLLILTVMDTQEGFCRLEQALFEIDCSLEENDAANAIIKEKCDDTKKDGRRKFFGISLPEAVFTIAKADGSSKEWIAAEKSVGRISGEFVMAYPPGQPLLVPGERISEEILRLLFDYRENGCELIGIKTGKKERRSFELRCLVREADILPVE